MKYKLKQAWKVIISLTDYSPNYQNPNLLFNHKTSKKFISKIGGIDTTHMDPIILTPTVSFYHCLFDLQSKLEFHGKKFPLVHENGNIVNINFHYFLKRFVVLDINYTNYIECEVEDIVKIQDLRFHKDLYQIVDRIVSLIKFGKDQMNYSGSSVKVYPCTLVEFGKNICDFTAVEIITRHPNVHESIVNKVIEKNESHQVDSNSILIDKQGVFGRSESKIKSNRTLLKKNKSVCTLLEIAIVLFHLLESSETEIVKENRVAIRNLLNNPNGKGK